ILLLHTGWLGWYAAQSTETRRRFADAGNIESPGLGASEEMARWLWDRHVAGVAADNPAVERFPLPGMTRALHPQLIGGFGMALGELWWLDELARDCARDGIYDVLLVSSPLPLRGGIGSPANAVAIK